MSSKTENRNVSSHWQSLVGFRISLLFNISTSKLVLLAQQSSFYVFPRPSSARTHCSLKIQRTHSRWEARTKSHNKMIVGDFCLKETLHSEDSFWLPLSEFLIVWPQWQPHFTQPNYFILQPNKWSLLCFFFKWTERVSDGKTSRYSSSMVHSKVEVHKTLSVSQARAWYLRRVFCLMLSWTFHCLFGSCYDPNNSC